MSNRLRFTPLFLGFGLTVALAGCASMFGGSDKPTPVDPVSSDETVDTRPGGNGIGVNAFLWRAALDTVSFMPLASADPFGGVIITDWYTPPETPTERFKINLFILDKQLHAEGIKATVFRQNQSSDGRWVDLPTDGKVGADFENAILTRARQLRVATVSQ